MKHFVSALEEKIPPLNRSSLISDCERSCSSAGDCFFFSELSCLTVNGDVNGVETETYLAQQLIEALMHRRPRRRGQKNIS